VALVAGLGGLIWSWSLNSRLNGQEAGVGRCQGSEQEAGF